MGFLGSLTPSFRELEATEQGMVFQGGFYPFLQLRAPAAKALRVLIFCDAACKAGADALRRVCDQLDRFSGRMALCVRQFRTPENCALRWLSQKTVVLPLRDLFDRLPLDEQRMHV